MNEVTKIHLGRQAFTISVDAHHELKSYLEAIDKQVGDADVSEEVELRIAELLTERGITANKVILPADVKFLKSQLGDPKDFKEDDEDDDSSDSKQNNSKRLFRDTDNAMIAGVASGLSKYFGIDVLLIRIIFIVILLITFGWGLLLYIVLWLLVPEAQSSSDRLRMAGQPVTLSSLRSIANRADVKGAAHRANESLAGPINSIFSFILKIVGIAFTIFGLSVIFGLISAETYFLINKAAWAKDNIFPIGIREDLLLYIVMAVVCLIALFIIFFGIAIFRRKWPIRTWVTGTLVGIIFIGLAVAGAITGNVYPNIRDRYNENVHSYTRTISAFNSINIYGPINNVNFIASSSYSVQMTYYGHPDLAKIKTSVQNNTLTINAGSFDWNRNCQTICFPKTYDLTINIYAPDANQLANEFDNEPILPGPPYQPKPF